MSIKCVKKCVSSPASGRPAVQWTSLTIHVFHTLFWCAVAMSPVNAVVDAAIVLCEKKPVNDALLTFEKLYFKHNQDSFIKKKQHKKQIDLKVQKVNKRI